MALRCVLSIWFVSVQMDLYLVMEQKDEYWLLSRKQLIERYMHIGIHSVNKNGLPDSDFLQWGLPLYQTAKYTIMQECAIQNVTFREEIVREELHSLYLLSRWAYFGCNVFRLSEDLVTGLLMSEPPADVEIRLPFDCFMILLPEGVIPLFGRDQHWAEMLWVHKYQSRDPLQSQNKNRDWLRWTAQYKTLRVWRDRYFDTLHEVFDTLHEVFDAFSVYNLETDPPIQEEDEQTLNLSLRLIKNLSAWLQTIGGVQANMAQKRFRKKSAKKTLKPKVWLLGDDVKLSRELKERRIDFVLGRTVKAKVGWYQRVRSITRGHFQHYWTGSKDNRQRVLRWKEPYWKNVGADVQKTHKYVDKPHENDE